MARRDRVPRHKSGRRKRNKNPKLSPFQLEQKRARLANQAPTPKTMGTDEDIPHSQRSVFEYLKAKRERFEKRKQERQQLEDDEKRATVARKQSSEDSPQEGIQVKRSANNNTHDEISASSQGLHDKREANAVERTRPQKGARADSPVLKKRKTDSMTTSMPLDGTVPSLNTPPQGKKGETDSIGAREILRAPKQQQKKKTPNEHSSSMVSLNEEILASVGSPANTPRSRHASTSDPETGDRPRTVEEIIASKKEKKHRKKAEARRQRVAKEMQNMEVELMQLVSKKGRKKSSRDDDPDFNLAFERKLKEHEKEKSKAAAGGDGGSNPPLNKDQTKKRKRSAADVGDDVTEIDPAGRALDSDRNRDAHSLDDAAFSASHERKRISFDESVEGLPSTARASSGPRRPRDFFELIDVPKFGERVEAPPVFEVVPNKDAAVSRLARKLEGASGRAGGPAQYRFLAEEKRLARRGLAPAIPHAGGESKKTEMELLREHVMATYRQSRRANFLEKKGVDMTYSFPKFSA